MSISLKLRAVLVVVVAVTGSAILSGVVQAKGPTNKTGSNGSGNVGQRVQQISSNNLKQVKSSATSGSSQGMTKHIEPKHCEPKHCEPSFCYKNPCWTDYRRNPNYCFPYQYATYCEPVVYCPTPVICEPTPICEPVIPVCEPQVIVESPVTYGLLVPTCNQPCFSSTYCLPYTKCLSPYSNPFCFEKHVGPSSQPLKSSSMIHPTSTMKLK